MIPGGRVHFGSGLPKWGQSSGFRQWREPVFIGEAVWDWSIHRSEWDWMGAVPTTFDSSRGSIMMPDSRLVPINHDNKSRSIWAGRNIRNIRSAIDTNTRTLNASRQWPTKRSDHKNAEYTPYTKAPVILTQKQQLKSTPSTIQLEFKMRNNGLS